MISKLDDYPIHQTPEPIALTATSDRYTYDRFWYHGHARDGAYYFAIGLARYPNLGILDCGFSVVIDGRQYAFHASRRAPQEPTDIEIGPFAVTILEPMGRHRVMIGPNDTGIECDLTFLPRTGAIKEGRQIRSNARHVVMDATRVDQFGTWQGSIRLHGRELKIDPRITLGMKDRSWGLRPVGERYTGGAPLARSATSHFTWAPIHWDDRCTLAGWFEEDDGYQWHTDQAITPIYDTPEAIPAVNDPALDVWRGKVDHQFEFEPGTRRARRGTIRMNDHSGRSLEIELETHLLFRMKGVGYWHPEWPHGKWQGELAIAGESWACDDVDPLAMENIHIQQVVTARCGDEVGYGVLEQVIVGPYTPYGMVDMFDGAP